jgi:hypothetical protein
LPESLCAFALFEEPLKLRKSDAKADPSRNCMACGVSAEIAVVTEPREFGSLVCGTIVPPINPA